MASILKCTRVLWPASLSHNLVLKVAICHRMPLPFMKLWTKLLNMFKLMIRQRNLMPRVRTLIMRDLNTKSPIFFQSNMRSRVIPLYSLFHGRPHRSENAFSRVHQSEPSNGPEQWSLETHIMVRAIRVARRVMPRMNRGRWLTKSYSLSISVFNLQKYDGLYCCFTSYSQVTEAPYLKAPCFMQYFNIDLVTGSQWLQFLSFSRLELFVASQVSQAGGRAGFILASSRTLGWMPGLTSPVHPCPMAAADGCKVARSPMYPNTYRHHSWLNISSAKISSLSKFHQNNSEIRLWWWLEVRCSLQTELIQRNGASHNQKWL